MEGKHLRIVIVLIVLAGLTGSGRPAHSQQRSTCLGSTVTIEGTEEAESIRGTPNADVIAGGDGDDLIRGFGSDDKICGGGGDDVIDGGPGTDRCSGGPGSDQVECEEVSR